MDSVQRNEETTYLCAWLMWATDRSTISMNWKLIASNLCISYFDVARLAAALLQPRRRQNPITASKFATRSNNNETLQQHMPKLFLNVNLALGRHILETLCAHSAHRANIQQAWQPHNEYNARADWLHCSRRAAERSANKTAAYEAKMPKTLPTARYNQQPDSTT